MHEDEALRGEGKGSSRAGCGVKGRDQRQPRGAAHAQFGEPSSGHWHPQIRVHRLQKPVRSVLSVMLLGNLKSVLRPPCSSLLPDAPSRLPCWRRIQRLVSDQEHQSQSRLARFEPDCRVADTSRDCLIGKQLRWPPTHLDLFRCRVRLISTGTPYGWHDRSWDFGRMDVRLVRMPFRGNSHCTCICTTLAL